MSASPQPAAPAVTTVSVDQEDRGIMIYDISAENMALYMRVWKTVRRRALQLNKSVYLIAWSHKDWLDHLIQQAREETGQTATASFVKVDKGSLEELNNMARVGLTRAISEALTRLTKKINEARAKNEEVKKEYFGKVNEQLDTIMASALMFGFAEDIDALFNSAKETVKIHWQARQERAATTPTPTAQ